MQQSNVIVGCLFIAFVVFITAKGELGNYIALLQGLKPITTGTNISNVGTVVNANSPENANLYAQENALDNQVKNMEEQYNSNSLGIQVSGSAPPLQVLQ